MLNNVQKRKCGVADGRASKLWALARQLNAVFIILLTFMQNYLTRWKPRNLLVYLQMKRNLHICSLSRARARSRKLFFSVSMLQTMKRMLLEMNERCIADKRSVLREFEWCIWNLILELFMRFNLCIRFLLSYAIVLDIDTRKANIASDGKNNVFASFGKLNAANTKLWVGVELIPSMNRHRARKLRGVALVLKICHELWPKAKRVAFHFVYSCGIFIHSTSLNNQISYETIESFLPVSLVHARTAGTKMTFLLDCFIGCNAFWVRFKYSYFCFFFCSTQNPNPISCSGIAVGKLCCALHLKQSLFNIWICSHVPTSTSKLRLKLNHLSLTRKC